MGIYTACISSPAISRRWDTEKRHPQNVTLVGIKNQPVPDAAVHKYLLMSNQLSQPTCPMTIHGWWLNKWNVTCCHVTPVKKQRSVAGRCRVMLPHTPTVYSVKRVLKLPVLLTRVLLFNINNNDDDNNSQMMMMVKIICHGRIVSVV